MSGAAVQSLDAVIRGNQFNISRPRSLSEFIVNPRRWQIPSFANFNRLWGNVKQNLLYFQTNYMIGSLAIFAVLMIISMKTLLTGIVSAIILIIAALFFFEHIPQARQIKQNHPTLVIVCGVTLIVVTWHALHTILIVLGLALAPLPLWLLHAMFRDSKGLIGNEMRGNYFVNTPVGQVLQMVGIDPRPI